MLLNWFPLWACGTQSLWGPSEESPTMLSLPKTWNKEQLSTSFHPYWLSLEGSVNFLVVFTDLGSWTC